MRLGTTLARAAGLGLCAVAFTGSALADPGNGHGQGNGGTPPGQEKKAEQQAPPAATATIAPTQAAAPEQEKQDEATAETAQKSEHKAAVKAEHATKVKATPSHSSKPSHSSEAKLAHKAEVKAKVAVKAATRTEATGSNGRSAEAHHHVVICHRTGSASNPYVVINIPSTAWSEAHSPDTGSHPDLDGRHDVMLKDPASRPGSKDGFAKSSCGASAAPVVVPQQSQPTDLCPNIEGMQTAVPTGMVKDTSGNCVVQTTATVVQASVTTAVKSEETGKVEKSEKVEQKSSTEILAAASPATAT